MNRSLTHALEKNNIVLSTAQLTQLEQYLELLLKWNQVFNLTAITDPTEMIYLHLVDSLMVLPYLNGKYCLDIGTGAGLPGIPLAITAPDTSWTLLDKNSKKTRFLTQVVAEIGLKNVVISHSRIEDFHPPHCFDSILSRALSSLNDFVVKSEHLLCPAGKLIAMKGKYPKEELSELSPAYSAIHVTPLEMNGMKIERHLVTLERAKKEESQWEK